jgi:hypothetical protein
MWRRSLGVTPDGQVEVRLFQAPDMRELESLPDEAVFVLRAIVQIEPARAEDVAKVTSMLTTAEVENALRYGLAHGYFQESDGRYVVSWGWFRAITRFLRRRHLLPTT